MLVLSRKNDQAVVIGGLGRLGNTIKVTVLEISGESVRLGFETAKDLPVHREEVWERIRTSHFRNPPTRGIDRTGLQDTKKFVRSYQRMKV